MCAGSAGPAHGGGHIVLSWCRLFGLASAVPKDRKLSRSELEAVLSVKITDVPGADVFARSPGALLSPTDQLRGFEARGFDGVMVDTSAAISGFGTGRSASSSRGTWIA